MERHRARLDLALLRGRQRGDGRGRTDLDVDLVPAQDDGNRLAHSLEVPVPIRDVLVRDLGRDVEHDDAALSLDVVAVAETAKLLLSCGVPHVETDRAKVGVEREGVHLDAERGWDGERRGAQASAYRCTSSQTRPANKSVRAERGGGLRTVRCWHGVSTARSGRGTHALDKSRFAGSAVAD